MERGRRVLIAVPPRRSGSPGRGARAGHTGSPSPFVHHPHRLGSSGAHLGRPGRASHPSPSQPNQSRTQRGGQRRDEDHDDERRPQQQRHEGRRQPGQRGRRRSARARRDPCRRTPARRPARPAARPAAGPPCVVRAGRQHPLGHRHPGQLEQVAADRAAQHRRPDHAGPPRARRRPCVTRAMPSATTGRPARVRRPARPAPATGRRPRRAARPPGCASCQPGPQQAEERAADGRVQAVGARVAERVAGQRPGQGGQVPEHEHRRGPWTRKPARACSRVVRVIVIAVDSSITRCAAAARRDAVPADHRGDLEPVERVAGAEQQPGQRREGAGCHRTRSRRPARTGRRR